MGVQRNFANAIIIKKYTGQEQDIDLITVLPFLEMLGQVEDIRRINKRNWRNYSGTRD